MKNEEIKKEISKQPKKYWFKTSAKTDRAISYLIDIGAAYIAYSVISFQTEHPYLYVIHLYMSFVSVLFLVGVYFFVFRSSDNDKKRTLALWKKIGF